MSHVGRLEAVAAETMEGKEVCQPCPPSFNLAYMAFIQKKHHPDDSHRIARLPHGFVAQDALRRCLLPQSVCTACVLFGVVLCRCVVRGFISLLESNKNSILSCPSKKTPPLCQNSDLSGAEPRKLPQKRLRL